jgi:nucleoside-diphosphate-sugar epimerase
MPTAFVTGATGCLGSNLVGELVARDWKVVAMHRAGSALGSLSALPVEHVIGDVTDVDSLVRAVPPGVDTVFHLAGVTSVWGRDDDRKRRVHVEGTRNVVEAVLRRGARRLVHTSTAGTLGERGHGISESAVSRAASSRIATFRTKWQGEQEVRRGMERGLDAVIMNPAIFSGPQDRHNWSRLFGMVREGRLPMAPPGRTSWAHVREVARAHVTAAREGRPGESYVLAGTDASWVEVLRIVAERVGRPGPRGILPPWLLRAAGRTLELASRLTGREPPITREGAEILVADCTFDCGKAVRELGFRPVPLRTILEDCHRWLVTEGLLPPGPSVPG